MQGKYVASVKPNPSHLATTNFDCDIVKKELNRIVEACKRNGCSYEFVLKDITTVCNNPSNLFKWERTAMEIVNNL